MMITSPVGELHLGWPQLHLERPQKIKISQGIPWALGLIQRGPTFSTRTQILHEPMERLHIYIFFSCERGIKKWRQVWESNQIHWPWNSSLVMSLSSYLKGLISISASLNCANKGCPYETLRFDNSLAAGKAWTQLPLPKLFHSRSWEDSADTGCSPTP